MVQEIPSSPVLIVGYGREGRSAKRFIQNHFPAIEVAVTDKKDGANYLSKIKDFPVIVRSPGIPASTPQLAAAKLGGAWVTSATNMFFSLCPGTVIGITGTKGKSTTSTLTFDILKSHYPDVRLVGNIGTPALDQLEGATANTIFVMELSSHQLEDCRYSPHIAVVLNIVPEHMDYYQSFEQYVAAKSQIVRHQKKEDFVIFNPVNKVVATFAQSSPARKIRFTPKPSYQTPLLGSANRQNIAAAMTVGKIMRVPQEKIEHAIHDFQPLPHRLEYVGEVQGIKFYNDSLATIPQATVHALEALGKDVTTLITGGYDRGLSYDVLGKAIASSHVQTLILFPDTGKKIETSLRASAGTLKQKIIHVESMEEAVKQAFTHTLKGSICLMSPASASFNLFTDYKERGLAFKRNVLSFKPMAPSSEVQAINQKSQERWR